MFLALRHLQGDLLQASSVGAEFQPALAGVQHHLPAFLQLQQPGAERHQARQALAAGEDGHVGGGAAFGHAQASRAGIHQRREVGGGDLPGGDDGASRHPQWRGVAEQYPQHAFFQVAQVVGALGQQQVAQRLENLALGLDRPVPGVGGADALVDQHVGGVQQTRVFQQREMRGKDRRFVLVAAEPGLLQAPLYVVAHPLQGLVQGEVLFLGTMPAVIRRQADGAEPRQGTAGQAGRSADAGQGTGDSRRSRRLARGDGARSLLRSPRGGAGEGREQGAEGRLAVFAATDHLYLVLFGDPQAHDADQAVDAGHLSGEVQFGLAGKALRGLA